jgi:hypothetical protein
MSIFRTCLVGLCASLVTSPAVLAAQSDISIAPFMSAPHVSTGGATAGLALTVSGAPGFAVRLNGRTALSNTLAAGGGGGSIPPWAFDADIVMAASGRPFGASHRTVATFVFIGVGAAAHDTAAVRVVGKDWSYGVGTSVPLGSLADIFVDSRWRIAAFVLPTASPKPARTKEIRIGMTFHMNGAG